MLIRHLVRREASRRMVNKKKKMLEKKKKSRCLNNMRINSRGKERQMRTGEDFS